MEGLPFEYPVDMFLCNSRSANRGKSNMMLEGFKTEPSQTRR